MTKKTIQKKKKTIKKKREKKERKKEKEPRPSRKIVWLQSNCNSASPFSLQMSRGSLWRSGLIALYRWPREAIQHTLSAFLGLGFNLQPQKKSTLQTFIAQKINFALSNGQITRLKGIGAGSHSLVQKLQLVSLMYSLSDFTSSRGLDSPPVFFAIWWVQS